MKSRLFPLLATAVAALTNPCSAALTDNLLAYFDFEETEALGGLNNKAPGATGFHATRFEGGSFDTSDNPSGPGFGGKADFNSGLGLSDRSQLRVGKSLNLGGSRGDAIVVPTGTAELGQSFTISAWHTLTPGAENPANRYHLFEAADVGNWDVSWGTNNTAFNLPQPTYIYLAYIGHSPAGGFGPAGVATNQWHHVAHVITVEGDNTRLDLYLDGSYINSQLTSTANMNFTALHFGRARNGVAGRDWDGMLDEVALWTRSLSSAEVAELYHRGAAGIALTTDLAGQGKAFVGVTSADRVRGSVSGSGIYPLNQPATITATAAAGYVFTGWSAPFAAQPESHTFPVTGPLLIGASFGQDERDPDSDGLSTYQEIITYRTNPALSDTDGDLLSDGAEINQTLTNPLASQELAVQWVVQNLANSGSSGGPALKRNAATNTVSFRVSLQESNTLGAGSWNPRSFTAPGVSVATPDSKLRIGLPGTSDWRRLFRIEGSVPAP
jgi:hypothetical protein